MKTYRLIITILLLTSETLSILLPSESCFEVPDVEAYNKEDEVKEVLPIPNIRSTKITIQSSDGDNFKVDLDAAKNSVTIRTMLEDLGVEANNEEDEVK